MDPDTDIDEDEECNSDSLLDDLFRDASASDSQSHQAAAEAAAALDDLFQDALALDSDSQSHQPAAEATAAASVDPPAAMLFQQQRKRKPGGGRPKGTFGSAVLRQVCREAAAGDSTIQPRQPAPGSSIEYARKILQEKRKRREDELALLSAATGTPSNIPKHEHDALREYGDFISTHTVGSELQAKLFQAVGTARSQNICTDDAVVDNALNGSMQTMSFRALQSITKESNLGRRLVAIARAVLEAGFYLWALFFVLIMKMCNTDNAAGGDSRFKLLLCCVVLRYDETPTRVRVDESNDLNCLDSDLLQEPSSTSATHAKILQVEQGFGVLLVDSSTGTYSFVKGQVPTGLFALKSPDGKTTSKALLRVLKSINGLKDIGRKCKFRVRHSCTDQAKSNYSAERLVTAQFPDWLLHHTPCDVHRLYRCTRTAMCGLDHDVSGMLSFALALGAPGSAASLRNKLSQIIARRLAA